VIPVNPGDCFCESAEEGSAFGLLGLMTGLSEDLWCAGWLDDLEYILWDGSPDQPLGLGVLTRRQRKLLRMLSEECAGWWIWKDGNPKFVSLEWWRAHLVSRGREEA
jgi:hypothetical protein